MANLKVMWVFHTHITFKFAIFTTICSDTFMQFLTRAGFPIAKAKIETALELFDLSMSSF
jgi:hypothetical protein